MSISPRLDNGTFDAQPFGLRDILETLELRHLAMFITYDSSPGANLAHRKQNRYNSTKLNIRQSR